MSGGSIIAVAAPHGPLRLGQRTFGRTHGNGREAPIPDLPSHAPDSRGSHLKRSYGRWGKLAHFILLRRPDRIQTVVDKGADQSESTRWC